jgi:hypothetical protein
MDKEIETWENTTKGRVFVRKFDARGQLAGELVGAGRSFHLTPQERRINQEMAASEGLDVFKNGILQPVRLLEGDEDYEEIASNPNHVSDSDIRKMVKSHHKTFEKRLSEIQNPSALQRVLEIAKAEDCSISTEAKIKTRLQELSPSLYEEVVPAGGPDMDHRGGTKAVTPR